MSVDGPKYTIGIDYGTLSARAVLVRVDDGEEVGSVVFEYPHGVMERVLAATGAELPPDWALQDPADYIEALRQTVPQVLASSGVSPTDVIGIGTDFTASSPLPVLRDGTPLCTLPEFRNRPHAYVKLWKHHAAQRHADRINELARERGEPWLARYGGQISSEWEFAKALQVLEEDPEIYDRMERWIEAADWIIWQLCGVETHNECTAGYKAIRQDGAYPSREYLAALDERFADFVKDKVDHPVSPLGARAGGLTHEAATWTGLPEGVAVAVGNVDAHVTAPAAQAIEPGQMLMVMGTSTCHIMNGERLAEVPGMCGVVRGGVVPGALGYEAGQSGVGDIFAWFVDHAVPQEYHEDARRNGVSIHQHLSELGAGQRIGEHGLVALDWLNGNRSILVDHTLSGVVVGLTLATSPVDIYRALLESTAFGTRKIIESFEAAGVPVREITVAGGLLKNPVLMQLYADVTRRSLNLIGSDQGPALGAAMHAAVAAGAYPDIRAATKAMGKVRRDVYVPEPARSEAYDPLYAEYSTLHDYFGRGGNEVLHRLRRIRNAAAAG